MFVGLVTEDARYRVYPNDEFIMVEWEFLNGWGRRGGQRLGGIGKNQTFGGDWLGGFSGYKTLEDAQDAIFFHAELLRPPSRRVKPWQTIIK